MKPRDLLHLCEELIKGYNPKRMTPESHADEFLSTCCKAQPAGEATLAFMREVLYGVMRYKAALKAFMTCFLNDMMSRVARSDYTMYMILAYLALFRLKELTFLEFRKFTLAIDPNKGALLVEYLFDRDTLESSGVVQQWIKVFDPDYVHDTLLANLGHFRDGANELVAELKAKSDGRILAKKQSGDLGCDGRKRKAVTKPVAPQLTRPNPRRVPEPRAIRQGYSRATIEEAHERPSTPGDAAEENASRANEEVDMKHRSSKAATKVVPMKLHKTRQTLLKVAREVEEKEAAAIDFEKFKASSRPPPPTADVRLNTSAILREDALLRQKHEQDAKLMSAYEAQLNDGSEFYRWQTDMKARDRQVRLDQIARTRILAKASAEEAAQAKASKLLDKRQLVEKAEEESRAMQEQRRLESEMTLLKNRHQMQEVRDVRDTAPKKAIEKVIQTRNELRNEVRSDLVARLTAKREEEERRAAELAENVKRVRADVSKPKEYVSAYDPSESAGLGLLDEMSLVEMQARLKVNKVRKEESCEKKRAEIVSTKISQRERIAGKVEAIKQNREAEAAKSRQHREQQAAQEAALKEHARKTEEQLLLRLVDDLATKRAEISDRRRQLVEEEERQAKSSLFVGVGETQREQRNASELLKGAERMAREQQASSIIATAVYNATRAKQRAQQHLNRTHSAQTQKRIDAARADAVEEARRDMAQTQKDEFAEKKRMYQTEKARHRARMAKITDPYVSHMNEVSIARAKKHHDKLRRQAAAASLLH